MSSSLFSESRLPVGSSARTRRGSDTRARATATRCCSPPESCEGRWSMRSDSPSSSSELPGPGERLLLGQPGDQKRHRHVLEGGELRQEVVELKDESDGLVAQPRARGLVQREDVLVRPRSTDPDPGTSSVPSTCMSVLFPTPEEPTIATISPSATSRSTPAQHLDRPAVGTVALDEPARLDEHSRLTRIGAPR